MWIKTTHLSDFDNLELKEATFQNQVFPMHFHDSLSIGLIREGIEKITLGNSTLLAKTNSIVIFNPYEVHSNSFFDADKWTYCSLYLNPEVLRFFAGRANFSWKDSLQFQNLIEDPVFFKMILNFHFGTELDRGKALQEIIKTLVFRYQKEPENKSMAYRDDIEIVNEVVKRFNLKFSDKINIDSISKEFKLSTSRFIRAFKAHTGLTPISYIILLRLNHSKTLILKNLPLVQVSLECGFFDQSHFIHYFQKFFGISPLHFKRNHQTR